MRRNYSKLPSRANPIDYYSLRHSLASSAALMASSNSHLHHHHRYRLSHELHRFPTAPLRIPESSTSHRPTIPSTPPSSTKKSSLRSFISSSIYKATLASGSGTTSSFTWDDVVRVSQHDYPPNDLSGFFERIKFCNRGSEMQSEFMPFVVEERVVGYAHHRFVDLHLRRFKDVFVFPENDSFGGGGGSQFGYHLTLKKELKTPEERTRAVGEVIRYLGEEQLITGIRNELYPVASSFGALALLALERAAAPYFGTKSYGVHMNGYVERDGEKFLWIGKRSQTKQTYPGMLDHLVAGGLPDDISCRENLVKECEEEAGIPRSLSCKATAVGAVSYTDIDGYRYKRDILFCYDLKLPEGFIPNNQDGEVETFKLIPVTSIANVVWKTNFFKENCNLVIIDFLLRHGYITPECSGYLDLLESLRSGDLS